MGKLKHGSAPRQGKTLTYRRWEAMMRRCRNAKQSGFKRYGAKGVKVAPEWHNFADFLRDMGECQKGLTLDRIDPKGDYVPGNCRWVSLLAQQRNRSNNNRITYKGETRCLSEWAERLGLQPKTLRARIYDHGWSIEKAFTKSLRSAAGKVSQVRHSASDSTATAGAVRP